MNIFASAPVPPANRLIDAPTTDLAALRRNRPADSRFPTNGTYVSRGARPTICPTWCSEDHRGQVTEVDGFSVGVGHEQIVLDLTASDPAWTSRPATARVLVESTTERGEVVTEPRIVLTVAEDDHGHYAGGEDVQGWTGTPEQAVALAYALIEAAAILRGDAR
ncbi:DUF6907 domain-containing protein [Micromonospora sp. NPDC049366]|uniref:DUF6907 domain-containing protein n=1 Tax=Micromonospora sp. NPDC049366 TaxID=3364271 RepID=UPI0037BD2F53